MKLLIVESPGKLKSLRKILGPDWALEASLGHTTELAQDGPRKWGFDLTADDRVLARYVPRGGRGREVLARLRKAARQAERVYLATDPDREGEAIAWHLAEQLGLRDFRRVTYTQITEAAVRRAVANPGRLDLALVDAQRARQCLDKLVGFEVSPLLWNSTGGKSAGRVQSATLRLICARERERAAFRPERYWVLRSVYGEGFEAVFEPAPEPKAVPAPEPAPPRVLSADEARLIAEVARSSPHVVAEVETKEESRHPPAPLITSSLQQMAGARFRYSPKRTMEIAQELYEGVGGRGLITYMRTDSTALSPEFVDEARRWIAGHSPESLPADPTSFRAKADAQGAHEAIRPTAAGLTPTQAARALDRDQLNVYTLVWERAIASQCKPARLSRTRVAVDCAGTRWVARGMSVRDPGYLKFWKNTEDEKLLPSLAVGQRLDFRDVKIDERVTEPPPRYTEPRLVQAMEKSGIGRPSTYASTVTTLKDREYVRLEKQFLVPTELGLATDEALGRALPELVDVRFTARMEAELDAIAEGKLGWQRFVCRWNREWFEPAVARARQALGGTRRRGSPAPALAVEKTERAVAKARKSGGVPVCPQGHGELGLRPTRKGGLYWRCPQEGCDRFAWYVELSTEKCPECRQPLEKVPSAKVAGGYFLKCARPDRHAREIVLFKDRRTRRWQRAGRRPDLK